MNHDLHWYLFYIYFILTKLQLNISAYYVLFVVKEVHGILVVLKSDMLRGFCHMIIVKNTTYRSVREYTIDRLNKSKNTYTYIKVGPSVIASTRASVNFSYI